MHVAHTYSVCTCMHALLVSSCICPMCLTHSTHEMTSHKWPPIYYVSEPIIIPDILLTGLDALCLHFGHSALEQGFNHILVRLYICTFCMNELALVKGLLGIAPPVLDVLLQHTGAIAVQGARYRMLSNRSHLRCSMLGTGCSATFHI